MKNSKDEHIMETEFFRTHNPEDAKFIYKIGQNLLFTPKMYSTAIPEERKRYANSGFVIGNHEIQVVENWIKDKRNVIILGNYKNTPTQPNIFAYSLLLGDDKIIDQVQKYAEDISFCSEKARTVINSRDFMYLIQIGISPSYHNLGYGSQLFQAGFSSTSCPIISFVIKSPIHNYPSLYAHLKNGYEYMGDYTGKYDQFDNYRSVGLIYYPNSTLPTKEELKIKFQKALL
ncbi:hypothetical protein NEF87_000956 [Candidatus Lokiarchaeum ossiferum]|uniref:N-acetyltransferase domain-containing protein n=1 Tax=Candidatus Lokiarchaeum ossiferum TaxID=2951803 RepID=A0ABY6HQ44_9ARCH|nr:hypothetical protein NEF87_000956 [Candidatus Lokiarchaeum sp. B-35]